MIADNSDSRVGVFLSKSKNGLDGLCVSAADSTLDSGMGSTVYSDSHSSQQSVLYQSLLEPITMATQQVCIWERSHMLNTYASKQDSAPWN